LSAKDVALLAEKAAFRPRSRLWELHELHVPFDELAGEGVYERRALRRITDGSCVAVIGPSGTGKSSVIAWLCYQLPPTHFALRIPVTAVEDPASVGEIARLTLSIALDEIMLDATAQDELENAHPATAVDRARCAPRSDGHCRSGPLGGRRRAGDSR
jgi:ABC-type transport system involved in cytochrome bd biosynthesis fused ATPase/permease subunit